MFSQLFQHVTYSQRNKLLNSELPLPTVCQSLTIQEAGRRIVQDGEETFARSQEDEETSPAPLALALNTTNKQTSSTTQPSKDAQWKQASN